VVADFGRKNLLNDANTCTVLIAPPHQLTALKNQSFKDDGELLAFPDSEALRALEVISRRRPRMVALERVFAATPRGVALISRIKADPSLRQSEIWVISDESGGTGPDTPTVVDRPAPVAAPSAPAALPHAAPLDPVGTRRAPRFTMAANLDADINGKTVTVIELSTLGAQVVSAAILKPSQRIRLTLADDRGAVRCNGLVMYASFEMPPMVGPRYRVGIAFVDADPQAVDAFRVRHQIDDQKSISNLQA
jgi:hypothetical protein